jgi:hypothetical protein
LAAIAEACHRGLPMIGGLSRRKITTTAVESRYLSVFPGNYLIDRISGLSRRRSGRALEWEMSACGIFPPE